MMSMLAASMEDTFTISYDKLCYLANGLCAMQLVNVEYHDDIYN